MRMLLKITCALVFTCLAARASDYHEDLAGAWVTAAPGTTPNLLVFKRNGGAWTGTMTTLFGAMELKDIVVEGERVSFNQFFDIGLAPPQPPTTVTGILKNGELRLKMPSGTAVKERTARRASPAEVVAIEAATPRKVSLDPLPHNGLAHKPPMGWNSWNKFRLKIDDKTVREVADAIVSSGLRDAGYVYVTIDDGWQGERDANGILRPNSKFPDMKALGDYIHSRGLKFGIYSSPGPYSCAEFRGSYGYEEQDAKMFAEWGMDYLKYDWCSADRIYNTPAEMQAVYHKMGQALQATGRPIMYSLCQYGLFDVGKWGRQVGGNLWRTTFDILDDWKTMANIGFNQHGKEVDAGPGGWNDPDMLEVGNGGMTLDEYRTHMTLWSVLAAPLFLGHDPRSMTAEIKALLTNKEVIAVDQDVLGNQGHRALQRGTTEVWLRPLSDGSIAVAVFNRAEQPASIDLKWTELGLANVSVVRDLWQQTNLRRRNQSYKTTLPAHGSVLLRVKSGK